MNAVRIYFCIKKLKKVSVSTGPLFVTINSHKMQCNLENKILLLKAQLYYIKLVKNVFLVACVFFKHLI